MDHGRASAVAEDERNISSRADGASASFFAGATEKKRKNGKAKK